MNRPRITVLVFGVVLEAFVLIAFFTESATDEVAAGAHSAGARYGALALALAFAPAIIVLVFALKMDGFSIGSMFAGGIIQAVVYWGWINSPQKESFYYYLGATAFSAVLIGSTVWFYLLQREK